MWNFGNEKEKCKLVDVDKYATNEPILDRTSMKAKSIRECTSLMHFLLWT
jgi:hypothetical protein